MSLLPRKLSQFLADLDLLSDRAERIDALISVAKRYRRVPERIASPPFDPAHKVPGCESQAYVWAVPRADGTLDFHFAVENPQGISAMAMTVILAETLSGAPLAEVAEVPSDVVYRIFGSELSMGKSMGLMGMVTMVRAAAARRRHELATGAGA
ncbi:MAG: SufE family protein [Acidobacteriota bacterium]